MTMSNTIRLLIFILLCIAAATFVQCDCGSSGPGDKRADTSDEDDNGEGLIGDCLDALDYLYDTCFMEMTEDRGYFEVVCEAAQEVDWVFCISEAANSSEDCDDAIDIFVQCSDLL